jgi:hypothetical protein
VLDLRCYKAKLRRRFDLVIMHPSHLASSEHHSGSKILSLAREFSHSPYDSRTRPRKLETTNLIGLEVAKLEYTFGYNTDSGWYRTEFRYRLTIITRSSYIGGLEIPRDQERPMLSKTERPRYYSPFSHREAPRTTLFSKDAPIYLGN